VKKQLLIALAVLTAAGFTACKHQHYNVLHVTETSSTRSDGIFYYLPRTVVVADVVVRKTSYIPGPFQDYAEQYLGYAGIQTRSALYDIENIILSSTTEPDPEQLYYIELDKNTNALFELEDNGLLRNVNIQSTAEEKNEQKKEKQLEKEEKDQTRKVMTLLNMREKLDTIYQRQIIDSVIVEKRSIERVFIKNTKEESAREAAKKITEIRNQRFSLISYNEEIAFESGTIEAMLRELDRMEDEYFRLFLGYTETETITYRFTFTPNNDMKGYQSFFKFSPTKGVNDSLRMIMETVYISQEKDDVTQRIKDFGLSNAKEKGKKDAKYRGLAYRVPEQATYRIILNNKVLTTASFPIAQLGTVQYLPAYDLDKLKVNFDISTGNIKLVNLTERSR